jgi:acyl carrier protein
MSDSNFHRLKEFIVEQVGIHEDEVTPDSRLYDDLGVYGDDAAELLIEYGRKFNVDVSKFMAADYFKGEGMDLIGGLLRVFNGKRRNHNYKVLTVNDLEKGIDAGRLDEEVIAGTNEKFKYQVGGRDFPQTHFEQQTPTKIEWLLLRIIDAQPSWGNDYRLERFMAKTDLCLSFYEDLRGLVKKGWLVIKDLKAQVKEYYTSPEGKRLLAEGYKTEGIKDFVMSIEPTGFIVAILETIDARTSDSPHQ